MSQRFTLYGDLSIDENVEFFARIHGVHDFAARRSRLLALTGLEPFRGRLASKLSGGMKQKLALACTLVHEPPILVLDEPTTGVDPVSRREFWKLLAEFIGQGLANVAGAFCSAMPCSGSFNRSGVNVEAGARTPLAAASAALFLLAILFFVSPWARLLPLAVIAGLLLVVAWGLIDWHEVARLWRDDKAERLPLVVTVLGTLTLSLEWAILLGIVSALIARRLRPERASAADA